MSAPSVPAPTRDDYLGSPDGYDVLNWLHALLRINFAKEEARQIQTAINRLSGHYQTVIRRRLLEDQTFAAIAQVFECTEGAIRTIFYCAIAQLQKEIGVFDDSAVGRAL